MRPTRFHSILIRYRTMEFAVLKVATTPPGDGCPTRRLPKARGSWILIGTDDESRLRCVDHALHVPLGRTGVPANGEDGPNFTETPVRPSIGHVRLQGAKATIAGPARPRWSTDTALLLGLSCAISRSGVGR